MTATPADDRVDVRQAAAGFRWIVAAIVVTTIALAGALAGLSLAWWLLWPAAYCMFCGSRAWGWAAGYRDGAATTALNLVNRIAEAAPADVPAVNVDPDLPGLVALREANARIEGWAWCEEHQQSRHGGTNPCDRLHQMAPGVADRMCGYHLRTHGPGEFGPLCTAWDDVARAELENSRRRRYLRWLHP
jgi:hypothetical protein